MKQVRGFLAAVMALAVLAFAAAPSAFAQGGVTGWTSGISILNLGSSQASVVITFYKQDGTQEAVTPSQSIATNASISLFPISAVSANFNGSAVISSDQPVAAITNLIQGTQYGDSAVGVAQGATSLNLPIIQRGNNGINTWFNVQNTGATTASVTVKFTPNPNSGTALTLPTVQIAPGASKTFDQSTADYAGLGTKFVGSALVTSDQPVAATINQVGIGVSKTLSIYNGFSVGGTKIYLPLLQANNNGIFTGIALQNTSTTQKATVTITYNANTAGGATFAAPSADTISLDPGASTALLQSSGKWPLNGSTAAGQKYVGSAIITSDQPVVATVNQIRSATGVASQGSTYAGFSDAGLTTKVSLPILQTNNANLISAFQCQNTGAAQTTITVQYSPNSAGSFNPTTETYTIEAGASRSVFVAGNQTASGGNNWGTNKYVGGANITSSTGNIACIANQISNAPSGDQTSTYNGINY